MGESAWGIAVATVTQDGSPLSYWYPDPRLGAFGPDDAADQGPATERDAVIAHLWGLG